MLLATKGPSLILFGLLLMLLGFYLSSQVGIRLIDLLTGKYAAADLVLRWAWGSYLLAMLGVLCGLAGLMVSLVSRR